jgi:hypothetical protein
MIRDAMRASTAPRSTPRPRAGRQQKAIWLLRHVIRCGRVKASLPMGDPRRERLSRAADVLADRIAELEVR